jgi:hypothetical protein
MEPNPHTLIYGNRVLCSYDAEKSYGTMVLQIIQ